jgi:hypothetical protein
MKKNLCSILPVLTVAMVIVIAAGVASAQIQQIEVFTTNYFSNNTTPGAPAATLRFTEHGENQIATGNGQAYSATEECAMIYVYAADQQLAECCGCPVSINGLVHENVQKDLLGNTLTRVVPNEGVIQIVSGAYISSGTEGICDPTGFEPTPEIDSWVTHVQNKVGTGFPITESRGDEELLSANEYNTLTTDCSFAMRLGSGFGVCTCNTEAVK